MTAGDERGPWINIATLHEADAIRDADTRVIPRRVFSVTMDEPRIVPLSLFISAFGFEEDHGDKAHLSLALIAPRQGEIAARDIQMTIQEPWKGGMYVGIQQLPLPEFGVYWISVRYRGRELTRIPLMVTIEDPLTPTLQA